MSKKYHWLKLEKDFYKRPDIKIIESQPDGVLYCYFYTKLLLESIETQGVLRYNNIPLDFTMMSAITNTSVSIVKSAIDIFLKMNMIEILEDGALFFPEIPKLLGSETEDARRKREKKEQENMLTGITKKIPMSNAERQQKYRNHKKLILEDFSQKKITNEEKDVTKCNENSNENVTKHNEKIVTSNVTCNENVTENVTENFQKSIINQQEKSVTEIFRKNSLYQEQEKDIKNHDHEELDFLIIDFEKIFHGLGVNYTRTNKEAIESLLKKMKPHEVEYYIRQLHQTIKENPDVKDVNALFCSKIKKGECQINSKKFQSSNSSSLKTKKEEKNGVNLLEKKEDILHFFDLSIQKQKESQQKFALFYSSFFSLPIKEQLDLENEAIAVYKEKTNNISFLVDARKNHKERFYKLIFEYLHPLTKFNTKGDLSC